MCLSFICDFWLLNIILNSTELKCTQNLKLYHFVRTILSIPFCPIPFCPYTILSIPFCPYHFVRYHFVRSPFNVVQPQHIVCSTNFYMVKVINYFLPYYSSNPVAKTGPQNGPFRPNDAKRQSNYGYFKTVSIRLYEHWLRLVKHI